jgi:hypothetical protein
MDGATKGWIDGELAGCSLADERLTSYVQILVTA